jgi:arylsulfatase A-like enzyme
VNDGARRPNIILILADDLGYGELGCFGGKQIPTPHIDSLAKHGVRCTNGYVTCPVCSPTRAGLLTGRYQQRFGHEFNPGPPARAAEEFGLPRTEKTLADYLKKSGYATGIVGKWHLGYKAAVQPQRRGFDEFFGFLGGAHSYLDSPPDQPILRGSEPVDEKEYLTDAFTREAVAFIDRHHKEPFFLYLSYNAVHGPMHASTKRVERFAAIPGEKRRTFATMLSAMDDGVGAVLKKLRETGQEDNTLIFFLSDNGGPTRVTTARNHPLNGVKGQVLEGGIRIPFIVQWKGRLPAGRVYEPPVSALDVLPTCLAAADADAPERVQFDGVDLLPHLSGKDSNPPHTALYWRFGNQWAIRKGDWKLLKLQMGEPRLFNLASDVGESKDLAAEQPELVQQLTADWKAWDAHLAKPLWGRAR